MKEAKLTIVGINIKSQIL